MKNKKEPQGSPAPERVRFKLTVNDCVFEGEADGSLLDENWRFENTTKAQRARGLARELQGIRRLTLKLDLGGDVRVTVTRGKGAKPETYGRARE